MTVQAQDLTFPLLLTPAPGLGEVMLFGVVACTLEAFGEGVILLPSGSPFLDSHDLITMANGGVDFYWLTSHDFSPFSCVDFDHWFGVYCCFNGGGEIGGDVCETHVCGVGGCGVWGVRK